MSGEGRGTVLFKTDQSSKIGRKDPAGGKGGGGEKKGSGKAT